MYILWLIILVAVAYLIITRNKPSRLSQTQHSHTPNDKPEGKSFLPPIPSGYQIYVNNLPIAGVKYRKAEALNFCKSNNQALNLEREPDNEHDPSAIKLIGVSSAGRDFLGYLPKEVSGQVVSTGLFDVIKPRLSRIYIGRGDFIDIQYQIIGPKANKKQFDAFLHNQPADASQKKFFKFFGLKVPKDLTAGQAEQTIAEHRKVASPEDLAEWDGYSNILMEFDDKDFRETYDLKKVGKSVLDEALNQLKQEGKTYSQLSDDIDEVVDMVLKLKPDLMNEE